MNLKFTTLISGIVLQAFLAIGLRANDIDKCVSPELDEKSSHNNIPKLSFSVYGNQKISKSNADEVKIFNIQGEEAASAMAGLEVITEGVVIGVFQTTRELKGYFLQDTTGDNNDATSDGIFIQDSTTAGIRIGNYIQVSGTVSETGGLTHLINAQLITTILTDYELKNVPEIKLPSELSLERYEGMLVKFNQTLTVSDVSRVGQFGELLLSANGRLYTPSQTIDPSDIEAIEAQNTLNSSRSIILDDGSKSIFPTRAKYIDANTGTIRAGSTVSGLIGIIDFDKTYKIQPVGDILFDYAQRPAIPQTTGANLKVVSFNLMNFFNGDGAGENFSDSLGASDNEEYLKQKEKIVAALSELNADILCLSSLENDGNTSTSAITDLVNTLNTKTGTATYQYVNFPTGENGNAGTDLTTQGIIYKPGIVTPFGTSFSSKDPIMTRPAMAQIFTLKGKTTKFAIVVSDLKNRTCTGTEELNNSQGCFNDQRVLEATALTTFIENVYDSTDNKDLLLLGNFNAFAFEEPINIIADAGLKKIIKDSTYSEINSGEAGSMLHAFATNAFDAKITTSAIWHINADEPSVLDYKNDGRSPRFFTSDPFRSSNVDPIIIGLNISEITGFEKNEFSKSGIIIAPNPATDRISINWHSNNVSNTQVVIKNSLNQELISKSIMVNKGDNEMLLPLDDLSSGLFFVEMIFEDKVFTGRFIITK